ncbi:hypothetical protein GCM10009416_17160 [Craurococcus roseus]|uniref:DUF4267 domain-containing protein n=1 Tax=Craurococcus roseus TaxID=77585 RepID=A0ABP3PYY8_9PROT
MARITRRFPPGPLAASPAVPPAPESMPAPAATKRRAALAVAVLLAVTAAHLAADGEASARAVAADPELARLLRAMAVLKASMAGAAVWLADRLLRQPLPAGLAAGLVLAVAAMAAAPVLMWHVAHVGTGALLFHAGMALLLLLGWRPAEAWLARRSRARRL